MRKRRIPSPYRTSRLARGGRVAAWSRPGSNTRPSMQPASATRAATPGSMMKFTEIAGTDEPRATHPLRPPIPNPGSDRATCGPATGGGRSSIEVDHGRDRRRPVASGTAFVEGGPAGSDFGPPSIGGEVWCEGVRDESIDVLGGDLVVVERAGGGRADPIRRSMSRSASVPAAREPSSTPAVRRSSQHLRTERRHPFERGEHVLVPFRRGRSSRPGSARCRR